ncbi:MAG: KH domain-containing protein [Candidatus Pacebacteria bacterium]|nr:KH domain-containing protein [Candidatus Paceibacterota bacterium]
MENKANNKIKKIIEEMLGKLTVDFENVTICDDGNDNFRFAVKSSDSGILIGNEGNNIKALNYLVKQIVKGGKDEDIKNINFFIDVNDYQTKNIEKIKNKALEMAEKAVFFKRDVEMDPMSSFERMIVHSVLADQENIETESSGVGVFRKVCIKYKTNKNNF